MANYSDAGSSRQNMTMRDKKTQQQNKRNSKTPTATPISSTTVQEGNRYRSNRKVAAKNPSRAVQFFGAGQDDGDYDMLGQTDNRVIEDFEKIRDAEIHLGEYNANNPWNYKLRREITAVEFANGKSKWLQDIKSQFSITPDASMSYGINAVAAFKAHCLSIPPSLGTAVQATQLTNEVHPIFSRQVFDQLEDEIYELFLPTLRLATKFITTPCCLQLFADLTFSSRAVDPTKKGPRSRPISRLVTTTPNQKTITPAQFSLLQTHLLSLVPYTRIRFAEMLQIHPHMMLGTMHTSSEFLVLIDADHLSFLLKLSRNGNLNPAQTLRSNFFIALCLCHELAHVWECSLHPDRDRNLDDEPYYLPGDPEAELGYAWEREVFGGRVWPASHRMDCQHGLVTFDWPPDTSLLAKRFVVGMEYVARIQTMEVWERARDSHDPAFFHVPRTGPVGYYSDGMDFQGLSPADRVHILGPIHPPERQS
ncbi:MAG: hypothetical protein M1834_009154 [Cirrosporium novae-zelandiae]|nr:MAG: hypothetical protein M1834_009154 [Cirrosporium novae-zelandiae]